MSALIERTPFIRRPAVDLLALRARRLARGLVGATLLSIFTVACGAKKPVEPPPPPPMDLTPPEPPPPPPPKTLFEKLGGREGLEGIIEELMQNVAADKRLPKKLTGLKDEKLAKMKASMVDHLCQLTEGPCTYKGKEMGPAHKGMGITQAQWDAFVEDLQQSLLARNVGEDDAGELFAIVAKFHDAIVEKKGKK